MAKKTPDTSKLTRAKAAPYTLKAAEPSAKHLDVAKSDKTDKGEKAATEPKVDAKALAASEGKSDGKIDAKFDDVKSGALPVEPHDGAPKPGDGPKSATHNEAPTEPAPPEAAPEPPPVRARAETLAMPVVGQVGAPPAMPGASVESPTNMPGPKGVPSGNPTDAAPPPGTVPPGDSRSLRKGDEFALVYRQGTAVISRFGTMGQRGQWRVVEYPTSSSASNAYAKECSRFVGDGFSDYRE
jgi:hypothetical protein